jgi:hypothetical protein
MDGLGATLSTPWQHWRLRVCTLVQVVPRIRPVEQADAHRTQGAWFKVPCIDTHVVHFSRSCAFPVHDAAAGRAAYKVQCFATPRVRLCRAWFADDANIRRLVVRPKDTVPPADRAVAVCEHARPTRDFDSYRSTVTGAGEHAKGPCDAQRAS